MAKNQYQKCAIKQKGKKQKRRVDFNSNVMLQSKHKKTANSGKNQKTNKNEHYNELVVTAGKPVRFAEEMTVSAAILCPALGEGR